MNGTRLTRTGLALGLALAASVSAAAALPGAAKVAPSLSAAFRASANGTVPFVVLMQEQADLTGAGQCRTKEDKGRFVYAALRATAARVQQPLQTELAKRGVVCRGFWIVNAIWVSGDVTSAELAAQRPEVRGVVADQVQACPLPKPALVQPAATLGVEWNIAKIQAPDVWALGYTGQGVVVGGQDTGYTWDHPALKAAYRGWNGTNADHNYNWHDAFRATGTNGSGSAAPWDDNGHGTHTMGTMVGLDGVNQIGVAPGARWIGARNMSGGYGSYASYMECFEWFLAPTDLAGQNADPTRAPDVMNNSWDFEPIEGLTNVDVLRPAVEACRAAGIVVVDATGNEGSSPGSVMYPPEIYAAAISVGAVDINDTIASFSSRGPVTVDGSGRMKPDVTAPGVNVRSSIGSNGYVAFDGTSMAAPHVAGTVALILSAHPALKGQVDRIETLLERTAVPLSPTPDNTYGWGRINALAAVGLADSDADGIANWWEIVFGMNPTNALDAADDPDRDGKTTWEEWICNTDPTNRDSVLRIDSVSSSTQGVATVSWRSRQDGFENTRPYQVFYSDSLGATGTVWHVAQTNVAPTGDWTTVTVSVTNDSSTMRYYRVGVSTASGGVYSASVK